MYQYFNFCCMGHMGVLCFGNCYNMYLVPRYILLFMCLQLVYMPFLMYGWVHIQLKKVLDKEKVLDKAILVLRKSKTLFHI